MTAEESHRLERLQRGAVGEQPGTSTRQMKVPSIGDSNMCVNPKSESSQFEAWLEDGILEVDINVQGAKSVAAHLREGVQRQKELGHVPGRIPAHSATAVESGQTPVW